MFYLKNNAKSVRILLYAITGLYCLIFLSVFASASIGTSSPGFWHFENNTVYFTKEVGTRMKKIYVEEGLRIPTFKDVLISPKRDKIALKTPKIGLVVVNPDKPINSNMVFSGLTGVNDLVWDLDGEKITYIEGNADPDYTLGKKVISLDISTGRKNLILPESPDKVFENLAWASFDGNLYLEITVKLKHGRHRGVFRFDFEKKEEIPTPYFGLNFSPNGKYYFVESEEGSTARLFLRETNEEIKLEDKGIKPWFHFYEWEVSGENTFIYLYDYVKVSKRFWKLDCANGKITHLAKPDEAVEAVGVLNGNLLWSKTTANSEFEVFVK